MGRTENQLNVEILDCTIRDGGYVNNWNFDRKLVREVYRALSKSGVDYVELGYHGTEKYFSRDVFGPFRFTNASNINEICRGISGSKVALMVDFGKFDLSDLVQYQDTPVKLIRLAFHKDKAEEALRMAAEIKKMGFHISANFMAFSSYTPKEKDAILFLLRDIPLDYVYIADSYGSMFPNQIADFFGPLLNSKHTKCGFHPHNNLQMAFANTLAAIGTGVDIVDTSIYGMGRGAGNLPSEIMVAYLQLLKPAKYNVIPILNLIDHYFVQLQKDSPWGYNLPYMLSGIYDCHPNYSKNLIERKEYDIEDIWKILGIVTSNDRVGYNKELLEEILKKGLFKKKNVTISRHYNQSKTRMRNYEVTFLNRHKDADFLVLANGPSLKDNLGQIKVFIDKYKPVILAANYIGGLLLPQYHAFSNKRRFVDYIDTVNTLSRLLIGQHIPREMIKEYTKRDYETIYYEDFDADFDIKDGVISSHCRTVSLLLMGVAIVMGAKRIFVAGLDGYMGIGEKGQIHFYLEKDETENREILMDRHLGNLHYLEQIDEYMFSHGKEGIHIITPTNYTKFYKGIDNYIA